jgi:hypothetical protein
MASAFHMQQPFFGGAAPVQKYDEDDSSLDDSMLDQSGVDSGLEMSPAMADSRRDSFAVGPLFSPKTDWSVDMQGPVASTNPFIDSHSNNPFMRMDQAQAAVYGTPSAAWSMAGSPMQQFDGMPYDSHGPSLFARGLPNQAFAASQMPLFPGLPVTSSPSMSASPQKDWMVAQSQAMAKKASIGSPVIRSHNELRRGDGIRKKNARFDIPVERTLSNIDNLISVCKNEAELKELKQQKRLLRNRQAALDSRQRKKQHTERLEDEKKHFTAMVTDMEEEMNDLRNRFDLLLREKQSAFDYIESMNHEKEEMIRSHTIETGELRKKISVLTDHVQRLETSSMSASVPATQSGYSSYEMDGMTMPGSWDGCNFLDNFGAVESDVKPSQPSQQLLPAKKADLSEEKPSGPSGLLFMLLLVGAFVLSSRSMPPVHRVSEDVRVASASLLENVLKDAGVGANANAIDMAGAAPQPSGTAANGWSGVSIGMAEPTSIGLGELGDALTQPTQQQTNEQIFSISSAQYNGVTAQDFIQTTPEKTTSQGRRNLAEALAAIRNGGNRQNGGGGAAEVYTKSLLWDQIPNQVVRDFAKMIAECGSNSNSNNNQNEQQCNAEAVAAS